MKITRYGKMVIIDLEGESLSKGIALEADYVTIIGKHVVQQGAQTDETIMSPCPYCLGKRCERCDKNGNLHISSCHS